MKGIKNRKGFEFSFGWIFSIIVGAVIIAIAVYAASQFVYTERRVADTEYAKELGILLSPLETNLERARKGEINFPVEARIFNSCVKPLNKNFGEQKIAVATKSGIGEKWQKPGVNNSFYNKYLFSSSVVEGKDFQVLSIPFSLPFKIGDIIILWSEKEKFCFVNPTKDIEEEIVSLNLKEINISSNLKDCPKDSEKVCFGSLGCDVNVNIQSKSVSKSGKTLYYEDSLIYGAIFSSPEIYECQAQRLMKRASELSLIYLKKSEYLSSKSGCSSNIQGLLATYSTSALIDKTSDLSKVAFVAQELEVRNDAISDCKIY